MGTGRRLKCCGPLDAAGDARLSAIITEGIRAYDALEYAGAVERLSVAIARASETGAAGLSRAELADAFLFHGLALRALGDSTAAFDDFQQAAVLAPGRALDYLRDSHQTSATSTNEHERLSTLVSGPAWSSGARPEQRFP